jgi:hypothetical protein
MIHSDPDDIGIAQFYKLSHIMRTREVDTTSRLEEFTREITHAARKLEEEQAELVQINSAMLQEIRVAKRQNPLTPITEQQQDIKDFMPVIEGTTFIRVVYEVVGTFFRLYDHLLNVAQRVKQRDVFLDQDPGAWSPFKKAKDFMASMFEFQINLPTIARYAEGIEAVKRIDTDIAAELEKIIKVLDQYYQMLNNRHVSEGMPIYRDAIMTDVALTIFANIDAHGEIEAGNKELSAYSAGKAMLVASSVKKGYLQALLREPEAFQRFIQNNIGAVRASAMSIKAIMQDEIRQVEDAMASPIQFNPPANYTDIIQQVQDLNAASVRNKESDKFLTQAEKYHRKFQDETMEELVKKILDNSVTAHQLMDYIIKRKAELHRHYQDENSFYVCKIGAGNPFVGEAPGALKVVPGNKPNVTIDDIKGSGFFDVKDFLKGIDAATRWHDLFLATSPSKKVDKNNILLIGPMGCGKSEAMRAVASEKKSIAIYAQGSDFLTCWKGEDVKNPKRLFEAAIKFRNESGRHVHILIDEIDAVLNSDRKAGDTNLTLEFQLLMDGIVAYPGLSVWGATNNPERIPMPMIRRFSKVLIVGELDVKDRVELLKHFVGFLPTDINPKQWEEAAKKLDGATGDVIRKVADHLWRTKLTWLVQTHPDTALKLVDSLNQECKFDIADFDEKTRFNFKKKLGKHISVTAEDLDAAVDLHLKNIAIRAEIDSATETYERAKKFLAQIESGNHQRASGIITLS